MTVYLMSVYLLSACFQLLCNIFRQINSGWLVTWMGDGTFNLCYHKRCAVTGNVNEHRNKNYWVAMAFVYEVVSDGYAALCKDVIRSAPTVKDSQDCQQPGFDLCDGMQGILTVKHMKKWLSAISPGQALSLPFKITKSDNMGKFFKFAKMVLRWALRNLCCRHLFGITRQKQSHVFFAHGGLSAKDWCGA